MRHFLVPPKSRCATRPCASSRSVIVTFSPLMMTCAVALPDAAPGHAPGRELAHGLGRRVDEHAHDLLVGAPVAALDRVLEVDVLVVALALGHVAEAGLHAALGGRRMRALRRHQRQHDGVVAAAAGADRDAQAGEAAADHQHVGVDDFHGATPGRHAGRARSAGRRSARARCRSSCRRPASRGRAPGRRPSAPT